MKKVSGNFDVSMNPLENDLQLINGSSAGRLSINKTFHGSLNAKSKGEMLSVRTAVKDSAGYVAIDQVSGKLSGKDGSFLLQHYGIMNRGKNKLILEVIPDSGTGQLEGITGKMNIHVKDDEHFYEFEYELK